MKRQEKEVIINEVAAKLKKAQGIYLTEFSGITVEKMTQLRNELRKAGMEYHVVKNTLIKKAMKEASISDKMFAGLKNTTGLVLSFDDPVAPAKIIKKFAADNDKLKFKMASVEGTVFETKQFGDLSGMFSRVENIGRVAGLVNSVMRQLVYVIDQGTKKQHGVTE
jgi:large subunit ribosomal protein L10